MYIYIYMFYMCKHIYIHIYICIYIYMYIHQGHRLIFLIVPLLFCKHVYLSPILLAEVLTLQVLHGPEALVATLLALRALLSSVSPPDHLPTHRAESCYFQLLGSFPTEFCWGAAGCGRESSRWRGSAVIYIYGCWRLRTQSPPNPCSADVHWMYPAAETVPCLSWMIALRVAYYPTTNGRDLPPPQRFVACYGRGQRARR